MGWTSKERQFLEVNRGKMSMQEMATRLGRTHVQVMRAMQRLCKLRKSQGRPVTRLRGFVQELVRRRGDRIRELNSRGYSDIEISKMIDEPHKRVWRARKALGLGSNLFNGRHRAKIGRQSREVQTRRVWSALEAERLGWPNCTLAEALVLCALRSIGSARASVLAKEMGKSRPHVSGLLYSLLARGLVRRDGYEYRLADGVSPGMPADEEE
jgi:predicted transcriptional regulator